MKKHFFLCLFLFLLPGLSTSAVLIETRDSSFERSVIYTEGNKARIETDRNGFLILDLAKQSMTLVLHQYQVYLDLSEIFSHSNKGAYTNDGEFIDTYIQSRGLGSTIAGYKTEVYELKANDTLCGTAMVSVRAITETGFRKFFTVLSALPEFMNQKFARGNLPMGNTVCDKAEQRFGNQLLDIGFPLRVTDKQSQSGTEVLRINKRAKLPANAFNIPQNYQATTLPKLLAMMLKPTKENAPDIKQMMQHLPPEAREFMKRQFR